jgi:hypothetical protein
MVDASATVAGKTVWPDGLPDASPIVPSEAVFLLPAVMMSKTNPVVTIHTASATTAAMERHRSSGLPLEAKQPQLPAWGFIRRFLKDGIFPPTIVSARARAKWRKITIDRWR